MKAGVILLCGALLITGCVRYVETRTESAGISPLVPDSYILISPEKVTSAVLTKAEELVAKRLSEKGYKVAENAKLYLQVGASIRPAALSLTKPGGVMAQADKKRSASECVWNEYRVSVALTEISGGREIYRGSAGEFHCKESFAETMPVLVDAALNDLGNPRGPVITNRKI